MKRDELIRKLEDSGLSLTAQHLREIPNHPEDTADSLTCELIRDCKLTEYQASVVLGDSAESLLFGEYEILDRIGQGGMGVVYKARRDCDSTIYALKILADHLCKNQVAIRRFLREAEFATQLVHPNIVRSIEYGSFNNRHFLAMEYVDGDNLSEIVRDRESGLPLLTSFEYLRDATRALEYAHGQNVIHRDVKPSNMLVHRNGTLKILDMGLARELIEGNEDEDGVWGTELTMTGTVLGTTGYMAPEQALNSKNADHRADLYGLGCSFYFMIAGKEIYGGTTFVEKIVAHREQPIPDLTQLREDTPEVVQQIFARMVAKEVEQRYQSACELLTEVETVLVVFGHMWMIKRYLREKKGRHRPPGRG